MEACDDIAYSVIDAEDTVKKQYASFNDLIDVLRESQNTLTKNVVEAVSKKNAEFRKEGLAPRELDELSMQMFRVKAIAEMVKVATDTFVSHIKRLLGSDVCKGFSLIDQSEAADLCQRLKEFDKEHGYRSPNVLRLELQGHNRIVQTMDWLWQSVDGRGRFEDYVWSRISENYRRVYEKTDKSPEDKLHLVCDTVSGMTDGYLTSIHDELRGLKE